MSIERVCHPSTLARVELKEVIFFMNEIKEVIMIPVMYLRNEKKNLIQESIRLDL